MDLFKNLFGGKSWYKSLTGIGLFTFFVLGKGVAFACGCDPETDVCDAGAAMLAPERCAQLASLLQSVGGALTVLGIRKAATAPKA